MQHLRQALNNPLVNEDLKNWGEEELRRLLLSLESAADIEQVKFLQGQILSLRKFLRLRDTLNG